MANRDGKEVVTFSNARMRPSSHLSRRPFWLPASSYYVLSVAVSAAVFFLIWDVLNTGREETPWVTAGISASVLLGGAVLLREVILRRARNRLIRQQRIIDSRVEGAGVRVGDFREPSKLTLEQNAAILREIKQKSDAAKILNKFSAAHREVFELCGEYMARNESELRTVGAGSPRLAPLLRGRTVIAEYHHYHVLRWAEIEARSLTGEAKSRSRTNERVDAGQNALTVIESALEFYPSEPSLIESRELVVDLIASIRVADWVERAERAAFKGNYSRSITLYKEALFYLGRENVGGHDRERAAFRINAAIEQIRDMESAK